MVQQAFIQSQKLMQSSSMIDGGIVQRSCSGYRKKRQLLQHRAMRQTEPEGVPPIVYEVLREPGQPLDAGIRAFMEPRSGRYFSHVRVHTDTRTAESARTQ